MNTGWLGERSYLQTLGWQLAPLYVGQQAPGSSGDSVTLRRSRALTDGNDTVAQMGPDTGATEQVYDSGTSNVDYGSYGSGLRSWDHRVFGLGK